MKNNNKQSEVKAFISYSSIDVEDARLMVGALEKRGVPCWFAERDIGPSKDFATEIPAAMESCNAIVPLLSKHSIRSRHVRREIEMADRLRHPHYPVRLLDVALTNELAYYIKVGEWLDLDQANPERIYDKLAKAILSGESFGPKKTTKAVLAIAAAAMLALLATLIVTTYYVFSEPKIVSLPQNIAPVSGNGNISPEELQLDAHISTYSSSFDYDLSNLVNVNIDFMGNEMPTQSIDVSLYAANADSSLSKIAQESHEFKNPSYNASISIKSLRLPETYRLCAVLNGTNGKDHALLIREYLPHTSVDPNIIRNKVDKPQNCDSLLGYSGTGSEKKLEKAQLISKIQSEEVIAFVDRVALGRLDRVEYNLNFIPFHGESDPLRKAPKATYALYGSKAGKEWRLLDTGSLVDGTSFVRQVQYRRSLPAYVRLCAITKLRTVEGYVESDRVFRSTGVSGDFDEIKSRAKDSISFGENSHCAKDSKN